MTNLGDHIKIVEECAKGLAIIILCSTILFFGFIIKVMEDSKWIKPGGNI